MEPFFGEDNIITPDLMSETDADLTGKITMTPLISPSLILTLVLNSISEPPSTNTLMTKPSVFLTSRFISSKKNMNVLTLAEIQDIASKNRPRNHVKVIVIVLEEELVKDKEFHSTPLFSLKDIGEKSCKIPTDITPIVPIITY
jgi:hypothetical protein